MTRLAVLLAALAAGLVLAGAALACSCAPVDARDALERSDGAIVGTLTERVVDGEEAVHTFQVETAVKGAIGATVNVRSHRDGATCGLEIPVGGRVGLFLTRDGAEWRASLCDQVDPDELLAAAQPLPAPTSAGPVALVVGGSFGEVRTVALDEQGRVVAYGDGQGDTVDLSVCPDGGRAVELVAVAGEASTEYRLEVRDLATMEIVATLAPVDWRNGYAAAIRCLEPDGLEAAAFVRSDVGPERLLVVGTDGSRLVWRGEATEGSLGPRRAYLCRGENGRTAVAVALTSGAERAMARLPRFTGPLTPSPGGRFLAGVAVDWNDFTDPQPARAVLVDTKTGAVRTAPLGGPYATAKPLWLGAKRVVVVPSGGELDRVRVFDPALRERGVGDWAFTQDAALLNGRLIGLVAPFLVAAPSPTGRFAGARAPAEPGSARARGRRRSPKDGQPTGRRAALSLPPATRRTTPIRLAAVEVGQATQPMTVKGPDLSGPPLRPV